MPPIARVAAPLLLALAALLPLSTAAQTAPATAAPRGAAAATKPAPKPKPVRNPSFYSAVVPVSSQAEKRAATVRGLMQVIVRLTGEPKAASNPVVRRGAGSIDALVTSSSFKQDSEIVNGVPVYRTVLHVSFDPDAVDALLAGSGLRYWSAARPKPILWLAIDDGRGPRLVTGKQTNVVKPLATRGLERGMRYLLPAGTAAETAAVRSIIGLNWMAMQPFTARYGNDAQLVGKVYRQPPGWAAEWVLTQAGTEIARWGHSDVDPRRVIASGVDEGANALALRDGVKIDTGTAGMYAVEITGVESQSEYLRLMGHLETFAVVRRIVVNEATPGGLRLQLDLSVGMRGFRTLVASAGVLRALGEAPSEDAPASGVPRFELQ